MCFALCSLLFALICLPLCCHLFHHLDPYNRLPCRRMANYDIITPRANMHPSTVR
ncbi:hypothetical protein DM02DRAFT_613728 [Periconia macrospinosa]|uniref:Uncharacterized protein n=1 Tax=Periconia macrospinosa TaxID=97972 RepID=A0A2V1DT34_9PLEO|nr:hypothetical protein DM02DRAFT_613728 [Periconia macrospinosa]